MPGTSQDLDAARAFYTRISSVYDALADRDEHVARQTGLTLLDAQAGEHVLEIGFGTGSSLMGLATAVGEASQPAARVADSSAFVSCFSFILQIRQVCAIDTLTRVVILRRWREKNWGSANHRYPHARQVRMADG